MGCCASTYHEAKDVQDVHFPAFLEALPSLAEKPLTVAITGCTSGTGFQFAQTALAKGATLIMLNRKSTRSENALATLQEQFPEAKVAQFGLDLQSFESVRTVAAEVIGAYGETGIDVLVNNAGIMAFPDEATVDGFDTQMQTNHLSHFLLTKLLFPLLEQAGVGNNAPSRIVNHSSVARFGDALEEKYFGKNGGNLGGNSDSMIFGGARWVRYHQSKLANSVFSQALTQKLAENKANVIAVCAAPGYASTNLQVSSHKAGGFTGCLSVATTRMMQSVNDGTLPILTCAFMPVENGDFWEPPGQHFAGYPEKTPLTPVEKDEVHLKNLWQWSETAIGEEFVL